MTNSNKTINPDEVHIWHFDIHNHIADYADYFELLDAAEKNRAQRFMFAKDRNVFVMAHGMLRKILAKYSDESVVFEFGPHQKPFFKNSLNLQFNLSHSENHALIAITLNDEIGVDIEKKKSKEDLDDIVTRFFSATEIKEYFSLAKKEREKAFYLCWSRKEAFIKSTGKGLFQLLNSFSVTLTPNKLAKIVAIEDDDPNKWQLVSLDVDPSFAAAVCWQGKRKAVLMEEL